MGEVSAVTREVSPGASEISAVTPEVSSDVR
jgi:hypothetical protein